MGWMASYDWYGDTDPAAFEVFIDLHRKMAPGDKLAAVFDMIDMVAGFVEADVRRDHPEADDREVFYGSCRVVWAARP